MTIKLFIQAILKYVLGVVLVGLLVFLPAGKFNTFCQYNITFWNFNNIYFDWFNIIKYNM